VVESSGERTQVAKRRGAGTQGTGLDNDSGRSLNAGAPATTCVLFVVPPAIRDVHGHRHRPSRARRRVHVHLPPSTASAAATKRAHVARRASKTSKAPDLFKPCTPKLLCALISKIARVAFSLVCGAETHGRAVRAKIHVCGKHDELLLQAFVLFAHCQHHANQPQW
jgi:hypothetical protein